MRLIQLKADLKEAEFELSDLYSMSDEAACFRYMVDSKEEAIRIIEEDIKAYEAEIELLVAEKDTEYAGWCDPAFRTIGDFDKLRA